MQVLATLPKSKQNHVLDVVDALLRPSSGTEPATDGIASGRGLELPPVVVGLYEIGPQWQWNRPRTYRVLQPLRADVVLRTVQAVADFVICTPIINWFFSVRLQALNEPWQILIPSHEVRTSFIRSKDQELHPYDIASCDCYRPLETGENGVTYGMHADLLAATDLKIALQLFWGHDSLILRK